MAYGLFQGLNEAYDAYRQRESEIAAEEQAAIDEERAAQLFEQQQEEYEYGVSQRPLEERARLAGVEAQEIAVKSARQQYDEMMTPAAIEQRRRTAELELEALEREGRQGLRQEEWDKIKDRAVKGAEKYRDWKQKFMRGQMSMEQLVQAFNTDDDESNNITNVTGDENTGWTVRYQDGQTQTFDDKYAVAIELESMADPSFHQQYLLQVKKDQAALDVAIAKAKGDTPADLLPFQKQWETNTFKAIDRLKGSIIKEGIVDFGTEGNRRIANQMSAIVNEIGAAARYQGVTNAEVVARLDSMMQSDTDLNPETVRQRAVELHDAMNDEQLVGGKAEEGTPEYDAQIARIMEADVQAQLNQLKTRMGSTYFAGDGAGGLTLKEQIGEPTPLESGASTSEGEVIPEPGRANIDAAITDEAGQYVATDQESRDARLMVDTRKQNYGVKLRRGKLAKPTAEQKRQLRNDYERNFYNMPPVQQRAWLEAFEQVLTPEERDRARRTYEEGLAEKQFGVQYDAEQRRIERESQTPGLTGEEMA